MEDSDLKGFDWIWNVLPPISLYHFAIVITAGYATTVDGYSAVYPVFAQYQQTVQCPTSLSESPQYFQYNLTFDEIHNLTKVLAEPYDECAYYKQDFSKCHDFQADSYTDFLSCASTIEKGNVSHCTAEQAIFDTSQFTSTVPSEFHIACGSVKNALATSLSFVGLFIGSFLACLSDTYGRRFVIIIAIGLSGVFSGLEAALPPYIAFLICRICVQAANQTAYIVYNVYACEVAGPKGRAYTAMIPNFTFATGYMIMSLYSYFIPAWRPLTWFICALTLPYVLTIFLWPESPRWLYSVGRYAEGEQVLTRFMKNCKVSLSEHQEALGLVENESKNPTDETISDERKFFDIVKEKCKESESTGAEENDEEKSSSLSFIKLFTSGRHLLFITFNICIQFNVIVLAYYGLSFSSGDLPGSIYVNNVISGLVEVASFIATFFLLNVMGRRNLTAFPLLFAGVCMIGGMLIVQFCEGAWKYELFRWLMFAGKFGVSGSFAVIFIYTSELYPTDVRASGLALGSMAGRIGGICAPFMLVLLS